jgi:hypothetical protein
MSRGSPKGAATRILLVAAILCATVWGAAALHYRGPVSAAVNAGFVGAFALCGLVAIAAIAAWRRAGAALLGFALVFALLLGWWSRIAPANDRDWQPDVARLAHAEFDGDRVTVRNVRNFAYRSETDYTPAYYDKTYDLARLRSVDLVAVYWMGPAIAHTFLSFGFEGGDQLAVSIETRKEQGEAYSTTRGFFKQYELYYVVADERDVIRLRTNYRRDPPEDVYLYRLHAPLENGRRLFVEYMRRINALRDQPEFYNTLADNCTTGIWMNTRINPGRVPLSWKILASGYVPEYLHQIGMLAPGMSFAELRRLGHVNNRAQAADTAADFSRLIRIGLPGTPTAD